jgi:DNA-binding NtrC family response regulator
MDKNASTAEDFLNEFGHLTADDLVTEDWYKAQITFRKYYIVQMIHRHKGNMLRVAEEMGIDRGSLYRMMKGLKSETFKSKRSVAPVKRNKHGLITMPDTTADML